MREIKLSSQRWLIDEAKPLGARGGFGAVFLGRNAQGGEVAIKRLHIGAAEAAHRELALAQHLSGRAFAHVIPIYDSGLDPDSDCYFVVMARAQHSLDATIQNEGRLQDAAAARVLLEIARGLHEVPEIVHRDLKPANVLWHEEHWKVADFGIARFVEEATSLRTLRECLTPIYAAPEQWRSERASAATDLYALGCIGYALLTGSPPFRGNSEADLKHQHLEAPPAPIAGVHPRLHSILGMLLRKAPDARPSRERTIKLLEEFIADTASVVSISPLAHVAAAEAARLAAEDAKAASHHAALERRKQLASEAFATLAQITEQLLSSIQREAPSATVERPGRGTSGWRVALGSAHLEIAKLPTDWNFEQNISEASAWDVIAGATVKVMQAGPPQYVWGASLWYARIDSEYRWTEVGYMALRRAFQPFALESIKEAVKARGPVMGVIQEAYTPRFIDDEDTDDFLQRWIGLLVKAYQGELEHPRYLPLTWDRL